LKEEKAPPTMDAQQDEAVLAPSPPVTDSCGEAPVYEEPLQEKAASVAAPADQAMKEASESTGDAPKEEIASAVETEEKGPLLVDAPQDEAVPAQVLEAKAQPAEKSSKDESAVHGAPVESTPNETCSKAEVVEKKETSLGDAQSSEALPKAKTSKDRVSFEQDPAPASPKRVASARQIPEQVDILREWEVVLAKTEDGRAFWFLALEREAQVRKITRQPGIARRPWEHRGGARRPRRHEAVRQRRARRVERAAPGGSGAASRQDRRGQRHEDDR